MKFRKIVILLLISCLIVNSCTAFKKLLGLENNNPKISVIVENTNPMVGSTQKFTAITKDEDGDKVTVSWSATAGSFSAEKGDTVSWTAPVDTATVIVTAVASDSLGGKKSKEITIYVGNGPPEISSFTVSCSHVIAGNDVSFSCVATDPEKMSLTYKFYSLNSSGKFTHQDAAQDSAIWSSPTDIEDGEEIEVVVEVTDPLNLFVRDTLKVLVYSNYGSLWVLDGSYRKLSKFTGNGIKIFTSDVTFSRPVDVESNSADFYSCFVADQQANTISVIDYDGKLIKTYTDLAGPIDMALHLATQRLWVLNYDDGGISVIDIRTGAVIKTIKGFAQPTSIEINQRTAEVWVLEAGNNRVIQIPAASNYQLLPDTVSATNTSFFHNGLNGPVQICIDPANDGRLNSRVYIVDKYDDQIEVLIFDGTKYSRSSNPVNLLSQLPVASGIIPINLTNMLLTINSEGKIEAFEEENYENKYAIGGSYNFVKPEVMLIDHQTGECWIGDNGKNQLVKIKFESTSSFSVLRKMGGFLSIKDIALNK